MTIAEINEIYQSILRDVSFGVLFLCLVAWVVAVLRVPALRLIAWVAELWRVDGFRGTLRIAFVSCMVAVAVRTGAVKPTGMMNLSDDDSLSLYDGDDDDGELEAWLPYFLMMGRTTSSVLSSSADVVSVGTAVGMRSIASVVANPYSFREQLEATLAADVSVASTNGNPLSFLRIHATTNLVCYSFYADPDVGFPNEAVDLFACPGLEAPRDIRRAQRVFLQPGTSGYVGELMATTNGNGRLFMKLVDQSDTDDDGRTDYEERLDGTDPNNFDFGRRIGGFNLIQDVAYTYDGPSLAILDENGVDVPATSNEWSGTFVAPVTGTYTLNCSADDLLDVTIGGISAVSYWSKTEHRIVDDTQTGMLEAGKSYPVHILYVDYGGESKCDYELLLPGGTLAPNPYNPTNPPPPKVPVITPVANTCSSGTACTNGCVSFSQNFGRTPDIPGLPIGRVVVEETEPTNALFTVAALKYDHPMMREIVWCNLQDAIVRDGLGQYFEYRNGIPAGRSKGAGTWMIYDGTNYVERISDELEVTYVDGRAAFLRTGFGAPVAVSDLGINVLRDDVGSITNIASVADGSMSATAVGSNAWDLVWTSPSGSRVKTFHFTGNGTNVFQLQEYRNDDFRFNYRWEYIQPQRDWNFQKGYGSDAELADARTSRYDPVSNVWFITETRASADGVSRTSVSVLSATNGINCLVGRTEGGEITYSAVKDENGFVVAETNAIGNVTTYRRDRVGRIHEKRDSYGDGHMRTTLFQYGGGDGRRLDGRPISRIVRIDGKTVLHEADDYLERLHVRTRVASGSRRRVCSVTEPLCLSTGSPHAMFFHAIRKAT